MEECEFINTPPKLNQMFITLKRTLCHDHEPAYIHKKLSERKVYPLLLMFHHTLTVTFLDMLQQIDFSADLSLILKAFQKPRHLSFYRFAATVPSSLATLSVMGGECSQPSADSQRQLFLRRLYLADGCLIWLVAFFLLNGSSFPFRWCLSPNSSSAATLWFGIEFI